MTRDAEAIGAGLAPAREAAKREALGASKAVQIVPAQFGPTACLIGAGLAALQSAG